MKSLRKQWLSSVSSSNHQDRRQR